MSFQAKLAFGASVWVSTSIIGFIYYKQREDREKLHAGVVRDIQRQEERRFENLYVLEQQRELTKKFRDQEQQMKQKFMDLGDN